MDKTRLYYQFPYVKSFMCTVEECKEGPDGTWLLALNQTGFYPEGGGQPSDTGTLGGVAILSVKEKDGGPFWKITALFSSVEFITTGIPIIEMISICRVLFLSLIHI